MIELDETTPAFRMLGIIPDEGQFAFMGRASVDVSLAQMKKNVEHAIHNRHVIELARAIVSQAPPRNTIAQMELLHQWMLKHFFFIRDPDSVELLHTPEYLIHQIQTRGYVQADCDDAAQLVATLGRAIGLRATFVAVSFSPGGQPFSHVFTILSSPGSNAPGRIFDTTAPAQYAGMMPPITAKKTLRV